MVGKGASAVVRQPERQVSGPLLAVDDEEWLHAYMSLRELEQGADPADWVTTSPADPADRHARMAR